MKLILISTIKAPQKIPPLSLAILASLTSSNWDIEIIDENFDVFEFKEADLVGITAFTHNAPRAYEIAAEYRKHNIKVVMGGIHASMLPDESLQYVDTVVIGEAEGVWGRLIEDFVKGEMKPIYKAELLGCDHWPIPRRELFHTKYLVDVIQTTRGCPMKCDFCSVSSFNGHLYRQRPVEEVITELKSIRKQYIFFLDDNIIGHGKKCEERALLLFNRMAEENLNKVWYSYASINFAEHPEIMAAASKCGCKMIFIGFESESDAQLAEVHKNHNIKSGSHLYPQIVKTINRHKIAVMGGFIMGFDADTKDSLKRLNKFLLRGRINIPASGFLTPFPGTVQYDKLLKEGRIIKDNYPDDWRLYTFMNVVFQPKNFMPQELVKQYVEIVSNLLSLKNIYKRVLISFLQSKSIETARWVYNINSTQRRSMLKQYKSIKEIKQKAKELDVF